jgi:hypothetical protein
VRFKVLTAETVKNIIIWDVAPFSLVEVTDLSEELTGSIFRVEE